MKFFRFHHKLILALHRVLLICLFCKTKCTTIMGEKVLVLNADFRAMSICSAQKAFILVFLDKAEVVKKAENVFFRTINKVFPIPSVIRLRDYVNVPFRGVLLNRNNIFRRDLNMCVYCGANKDLTLDHVLPKSRGGKTSWQNLVTACKKCNGYFS